MNDLKRVIKGIQEDDNCWWIGMGDYIEAINISDPRFDPDSIAKDYAIKDLGDLATIQARRFCLLLEPIIDKCIGLLEGNHEDTIRRYYHKNVVADMAERLNVKYLGIDTLTRLRFVWPESKRTQYTRILYAHHGEGGGRKAGGAVNKLMDLSGGFNADIYAMGHVHKLLATKDSQLSLTDARHPELLQKLRAYVLTGSFFRTYQMGSISYGERKIYSPSVIGCAQVMTRVVRRTHKGRERVAIAMDVRI